MKGGLERDAVELSDEFLRCRSLVNEMVDKELEDLDVHRKAREKASWIIKKRILKEEFDIDWKSPLEINPNLKID